MSGRGFMWPRCGGAQLSAVAWVYVRRHAQRRSRGAVAAVLVVLWAGEWSLCAALECTTPLVRCRAPTAAQATRARLRRPRQHQRRRCVLPVLSVGPATRFARTVVLGMRVPPDLPRQRRLRRRVRRAPSVQLARRCAPTAPPPVAASRAPVPATAPHAPAVCCLAADVQHRRGTAPCAVPPASARRACARRPAAPRL